MTCGVESANIYLEALVRFTVYMDIPQHLKVLLFQ